MSILERIKRNIIDREYYLSSHTEIELVEDNLTRHDVENAILEGFLDKELTHDLRGTRYRIEGPALDGREIHVICRFLEEKQLLIITAYELR